MKTMFTSDYKYTNRLEVIALLQVLHTQLDKLIASLDDGKARRDSISCLNKVIELEYQLRTTFADCPVLTFYPRADIGKAVFKAKLLLNKYGNA